MAKGVHPAFRVSVRHRRSRWCGYSSRAGRFEHGVAHAGALARVVVVHEPELTADAHEEVPGDLGGPVDCRVGGDPGDPHRDQCGAAACR